MRICRFKQNGPVRVGLVVQDSSVIDLSAAGITSLTSFLEEEDAVSRLAELAQKNLPQFPLAEVQLLAPVERQEVWAAGVTYLRSKTARMEESDFSANAYDKVYSAERPELFFKSLAEKVAGPDESVGIRRDAKWNVPEPELALVVNTKGRIVGYTAGNDMSSRDIEGENPLYLPQAKVYDRSCAIGPCILVAPSPLPPSTEIQLEIMRGGKAQFSGSTALSAMKRDPVELADYLYRNNSFPSGCLLLTGTGVVPPDAFTLQQGDEIRITIPPIGTLVNTVG
jgi:2-dehydro-3-deoxy-D-arabinonate dehydratase